MKLNGNYKEWSVTQTQLGKILEVSQPRINQLIDEEIVQRDESSKSGMVLLIDSLKNYYLSKAAAVDGGGTVNFWKEKGLHERAKRQLAELKLRQREGELYEAEIVEAVMIEHLTNFRNKLLGIPAKMAIRLEGKTRSEIYDGLTQELEECLTDLSQGYKNATFEAEVVDADEDAEE